MTLSNSARGLVLLLCGIILTAPTLGRATPITDTAWARIYSSPGNAPDVPADVKLDPAGNVYVTGRTPIAGQGLDYATLKYDPNGVLLWDELYNGPASDVDSVTALWVDGAGNVYVTGGSVGTTSSYDFATLKYDTDGNLLWERRYNGPANLADRAMGLFVDPAGNVYVTGHSWGLGSGPDYATIKYDASGTQQWVKRYSFTLNGQDSARVVEVDADGNVYVTGTSYDPTTLYDIATLKYNSAGGLLWSQRYHGTGGIDDRPYDMTLDENGNVYVTGVSWSFGTRDDYVVLKYDTDGNLLWDRLYDGTGSRNDLARVIKVDAAHNVYVTGGSDGPSPFFDDMTTLKYDPDGNLLWDRRYDGPFGGDDAIGFGLHVDAAGKVYVGGYSDSVVTDFTALIYDSDGALTSVRRFNDAAFSDDMAYAMAVDDDGFIHLTGVSNPAGQTDFSTVKFIPCACAFQSDIDEDGYITPIDLARVIDIIYTGGFDPQDPACPSTRFDFDCDGFVTVLDLTGVVDYLYDGGPGPCDPCVP